MDRTARTAAAASDTRGAARRPLWQHADADIVAVAEGLVRVVGTDGAAEQLRRIYGERRAAEALLGLAVDEATAPARAEVQTTTTASAVQLPAGEPTGAILSAAHPRHRLARPVTRAYGPAPVAGGRKVYWL